MPLEITTMRAESVCEIVLVGDLDASTTGQFQEVLEALAKEDPRPTELVLRAQGLAFLASAGVRLLFITKQRLFPGLRVYVVKAQEPVLDTLRRTGADRDFILLDEYPPPVA